ncbi:CAT2 (YML042W) [Zygosaccharomyces parabailii]|uniref:Carnitine O-acetyltransferase, mitochondrial n=1 Tax=Zygosaccharomyces bailii (strain CLIB 213 / ATCC 58445 / CBS 680 / BCRC 21525 / NBRC 1098 / NCYC 1416 / NRRL Y-2227) TaxID=1333698 RepID=A0A8J2X8C2_ZYGB2|nr:CAT2 (YML042W) [Zygosaccharomyces parabailii]CDF89893.1 ZYBA0S05-04192g1_1 [Zygosaccharomyces bailii CLIB 213]CDH17651.1 probable Carnitine O-acetyltransferase,mitochondrial [Zygosaccharomyces bailii ISA1307]
MKLALPSLRPLTTVRRMTNIGLKSYEFASGNGEHYLARHPNKYYQSKRPGYKGDTFGQQKQLPALVVPELKDTISKYLASIKPYCQQEGEFAKQELLCKELLQKTGPQLQARLIEFAKDKRNWLSEFWDNQSYLEYDDPVVPYVSYFFSHRPLPTSHRAIDTDPLLKATAIVTTVSKFVESIKDESFPAEVIKGAPFCMNGFQLMFNSARVPGPAGGNRDSYVFHSLYENNYIVVSYKRNFYKVYTHDGASKPYGARHIWEQLYAVVNKLSTEIPEEASAGVGLLTTLPRDQWRHGYAHMIQNPLSRDSLETIQGAAYLLALDDTTPVTLEEKSRNYWHSDGSNRFFDKFLQFFVTRNGCSGFLAEHSKMDGTPTCTLNDYVARNLALLDPASFLQEVVTPAGQLEDSPRHLPFLITPLVKEYISKARQQFNKTISEHELRVWHYNRLGKSFAKKNGMSPDAFIQQIIQLAVYKYMGRQLPTYEAASTRKYFKGRTETGRPVSEASAHFVKTWESPVATDEEKIAALKESAKYHSSYLKMAADGYGVDRHLFGLKNMLTEADQVPALFKDPLFHYSSTWLISTSQLSSEYFDGYGWSQVNDNGFGLAYMLNNDWLHINIVNKPEKSALSVHKMHYYLSQAADDIADTLIRHQTLKAKL